MLGSFSLPHGENIRLSCMDIDIEDEPGSAGGTLIRSFGELWSRDAVDWEGRSMLGERKKFKVTVKNPSGRVKFCNIWNQRGIYALYRDFQLVYVGQATSADGIGGRLNVHVTKSRFHRQWDSFSWFSFDGFDAQGKPEPYRPEKVDEKTIARTLELVTMLIANPPLNRSRGRFKGAEKINQGKSDTRELSNKEVLQKMRDLLDSISRR